MTQYLDSFEEFNRIKNICHRLFEINKTIPEMVFKKEFDFYYFADYSILFTSKAPHWDNVLTLARKPDTGRIVILVLDPDPESYYSWCKRYGTVLIDPKADKEDILEALSVSPIENTGDAMYVIVDRFVVFSEYSQNWCLWADRYYETAILAFNNFYGQQEIEKTLSDGWFNTKQALDELLPLAFFPKHIPEDFYWEFLANYGTD